MEPTPQGVPPGARRLIITSVFTPASFWGHEAIPNKPSTADEQLVVLERDITGMFSNTKYQDTDFKPAIDQLVAVFDPKKKKWVRGQVLQWDPDGLRQVFLVDYGSHLADVKFVQPLPNYSHNIPHQAIQMFLYGVLPVNNKFDFEESCFQKVVNDEWMSAAMKRVEDILSDGVAFYFSCAKTWGKALLGDLFVIHADKPEAISLTKTLINEQLAVYDYECFTREIMARVGPYLAKPLPTESIQSIPLEQMERSTSFASFLHKRKTMLPVTSELKVSKAASIQNQPIVIPAGFREKEVRLRSSTKEPLRMNQNQVSSEHDKCVHYSMPGSDQDRGDRVKIQHSSQQFVNTGMSPLSSSGDNISGRKTYVSPSENNVSGITRPSPSDGSMLAQIVGAPAPNAEVMYKQPQPQESHRVVSVPRMNMERSASSGSLPPPANKSYTTAVPKKFFQGNRSKSGSHSSPTSSRESEQWYPHLFAVSPRQLPVLVKGCSLSRPIESVGKAPLNTNISRLLEHIHFTGLTMQQKYMWPAVLRGQNVISVGPPQSGKTLGFVVPLASKMLDPSLYVELKELHGPLVLILCANAEKATFIESFFKNIVKNDILDFVYSCGQGYRQTFPRVNVLLTYGGGAESEKLIDLLNGCDVLISTPPCLLRMIAYWDKILKHFDRLCHLVFDEADSIFENFIVDVNKIITLVQKGLAAPKRKDRSLQTIITAQKWTVAIEQFSLNVVTDPMFVINSGLEILAYSKIIPTLHMVSVLDQHSTLVVDIVKNLEHPYKAVIACSFDCEALEMHRLLQSVVSRDSCLLMVAHSNINQLGLISLKERWSGCAATTSVLLVVSDSVLSEMEIYNANILIHAKLMTDRSYFNTRMACIINQCPDRFSSSQEKQVNPIVHIVIAESDIKPIPAVLELMRRLKAPVSEILVEREKQAEKIRDGDEWDLPLCDQLCNFGECIVLGNCKCRHTLSSEMDRSPIHLPQSGEVKLKVLMMNSATHFAAKLEEHTSPEGKVTDLKSSEDVYMAMDLTNHFTDPTHNVVEHEEPMEFEEIENTIEGREDPRSPMEGIKESKRPKLQLMDDNTNVAERKLETDKIPSKLVEIRGNLFDSPPEYALAHCIGEDLIMGRGIAKEFSKRFGQVDILRNQKKKCGEVAHIKVEGRYIFYLICKRATNCRNPSLQVLQDCLVELKKLCKQLSVTKLALPKLGTGMNNFKWNDVKTLIEDIFYTSDITIHVYHCVLLEREGDLLRAPLVYSLAHCVAEDFKMSRGMAKQIKEVFGGKQYLLRQNKKSGEVAYLRKGKRYIFYLVTKLFSLPSCKPTLESLRSSLFDLKRKCLELGVRFLAMPRIGTGIDQLDWVDVKESLQEIFEDTDVEIVVYQLPPASPWRNPDYKTPRLLPSVSSLSPVSCLSPLPEKYFEASPPNEPHHTQKGSSVHSDEQSLHFDTELEKSPMIQTSLKFEHKFQEMSDFSSLQFEQQQKFLNEKTKIHEFQEEQMDDCFNSVNTQIQYNVRSEYQPNTMENSCKDVKRQLGPLQHEIGKHTPYESPPDQHKKFFKSPQSMLHHGPSIMNRQHAPLPQNDRDTHRTHVNDKNFRQLRSERHSDVPSQYRLQCDDVEQQHATHRKLGSSPQQFHKENTRRIFCSNQEKLSYNQFRPLNISEPVFKDESNSIQNNPKYSRDPPLGPSPSQFYDSYPAQDNHRKFQREMDFSRRQASQDESSAADNTYMHDRQPQCHEQRNPYRAQINRQSHYEPRLTQTSQPRRQEGLHHRYYKEDFQYKSCKTPKNFFMDSEEY